MAGREIKGSHLQKQLERMISTLANSCSPEQSYYVSVTQRHIKLEENIILRLQTQLFPVFDTSLMELIMSVVTLTPPL